MKGAIILAVTAIFFLPAGRCLSQTETAGKLPQRVVTDSPAAAEIMLALSAGQRLAGVAPELAAMPLFKTLAPEWSALPAITVNGALDGAAAAALKPDLAVLRSAAGSEPLTAAGISTIFIQPTSFTEVIDSIGVLAKALGAGERGAFVASELKSRLQLPRERTQSLSDDQKPSLYFSGPDGLLSAPAADMHQVQIGRLAGARPVEAATTGGWQAVTPEQLLGWNPDVIVILPYPGAPLIEDVMADPRWQPVKAVATGRVYVMPSSANGWDQATPTGILGLMWLVKALHAEHFLEIEPQVEADAVFGALFGIPFTKLSREDLAPKSAPLPRLKETAATAAPSAPAAAAAPAEPESEPASAAAANAPGTADK